MGRHAAGESFLRGLFSHAAAADYLSVQVENNAHAEHFAAAARQAGRTERIRSCSRHNLARLKESGVLYFPGPTIGEHAF